MSSALAARLILACSGCMRSGVSVLDSRLCHFFSVSGGLALSFFPLLTRTLTLISRL
jgi:hypothetical protein